MVGSSGRDSGGDKVAPPRPLNDLVPGHFQAGDQDIPGLPWIDDVIDQCTTLCL